MDTTRDFHTKVSQKEKDKYCMISLKCGIGLPRWLSGKELPTSIGDIRETYSVREDPRRRAWQATPIFLPGEFCGQRNLAGYAHD